MTDNRRTRDPCRWPVDPPYPVVIGTGLLDELEDLLADRHKVVVHQPGLAETAEEIKGAWPAKGRRRAPHRDPRRRAGRTCPSWDSSGKAVVHRNRPQRRPGQPRRRARHRRRRVRGVPGCAASRLCTAHHTAGWSIRPSTARPASTPTPAEPGQGAFHQPLAVLVDLATLQTLPRDEMIAAAAEVVKAGFISR